MSRKGGFPMTKLRYLGAVSYGLLILAALSLASCGGSADLPPDQVLNKASTAIGTATSFHFLFEASKPEKPVPGLFVSKAEGSVAKPDKLSASVDATMAGFAVNVKAIVNGQDQYMTDPVTGKWSKASAELNVTQYFDPAKGAASILTGLKGPTADGHESVDGTDCYRIKGKVPASALQALSPDVSGASDLNTTLWIGSSDFLVRRVKLEGPFAQSEPSNMVRTITFSDYNKDVKIEPPQVGQ